MFLKCFPDIIKLLINFGIIFFQLGNRKGSSCSCNNIFSLCIKKYSP